MQINNQAEELNIIIKQNNLSIYNLLSEKGKAIFFPKEGIPSQAEQAKNKKINATAGIALRDDNTPMRLSSIEKNVLLNPKDVFTYAPSFGKQELRQKWKDMIYEKNPALKDKELSLPIVTSALTHGLSMAGYLFVNEGDNILLPDIFWGNYNLIYKNAYRANITTFNLFKDNKFNLESFKEELNKIETKKKIIILNFPNNPTGYSPTDEEADKIAAIIKEDAEKGNEIIVLSDDAYFGLVYEEDKLKESIFSKLAYIHENVLAIKLDGATKEDFVWGFRVGFITFASKDITQETCKALEDKTAGAIRGNISSVAHLSQSLVLEAFNSQGYKEEKQEKFRVLESRFKKVKQTLEEEKEKFSEFFEPLPFNSGYFMCVKLKNCDCEKVRMLLLDKYDTGTISMKNIIRIAFSSVAEKDIKELFENIYKACKEIRG